MAADPRSRSERRLSAYRHLVFDLDGTLIDSAHDLVSATNRTLVALGLAPLPPARVLRFVGQGVRRLLSRSLEAAGADGAPELLEHARVVFDEIYGAGLLEHTRPYPGVTYALEGLAARDVVMSVLTNKPRAFTRVILDALGLAPWFAHVACGDDPHGPKPAPGGAVVLVTASGVAAVATVLVGDSVEDIATARGAGIASCAVTWGFRSREELAAEGPDHRADEPRELLDLT